MNGVKTFKEEEKTNGPKNDTKNLMELLLRSMGEADPMRSMLEWLCTQLTEAEVSGKLSLDPQSQKRRLHPFLVTKRKRSEAALIQVVQPGRVSPLGHHVSNRIHRGLVGFQSVS